MSASEQLAFDFDVAPEWVPIAKPFGISLGSLLAPALCRDCGAKAGFNQGGSRQGFGIYMVCDDCARIDAFRLSGIVAGSHTSRWGMNTVRDGRYVDGETHHLGAEAKDRPSTDTIKAELSGKNLVCWCPLPVPGEPDHCHAAVLLRIANR